MRFVLLLVAAVIAVVAGVVALKWSGQIGAGNAPSQQMVAATQPGEDSPNVNAVDILVAKKPISVGTVIDETMIDKQPWPEHLLLEGFIIAGSKDANLVGKVARSNFQPHEPFMRGRLANPNDPSFLAAMLPEGMRAVTLATDAISGVAGYVFPGDHVDILVTHNIPQEIKNRNTDGGTKAGTSNKPAISEVLATDVRVLAVNVREPAGKESVIAPSSITLEVTDAQAQQLRLAEKNGTLSLTLRPLKDKDGNEPPPPTRIENLTHVEIGEQASSAGIRIIRGAGDEGTNTKINEPQAEEPPPAPSQSEQ